MMYLNLPKYPRYLTAAAGSLLMTGGITYLMVQLVAMDDYTVPEAAPLVTIDYYKVRDDKPPVVKEPEIKRPEPPKREPEAPQQLAQLEIGGGGVGVNMSRPVIDSGLDVNLYGPSDGEHIPLVRVAPTYPQSAITRGLEGYVVLSFTITPSGGTADPAVIDSQPRGVFDRAAINAVRKFKYKPKIVNGEPQTVHNVQHRVTFELANG